MSDSSLHGRYLAYGLAVRSTIPLPELDSINSEALDVDIVIGPVPQSLQSPVFEGLRCQACRGQVLLRVDGVGWFHVASGKRITVEPANGADDRAVRLFLLDTALKMLLLQREELVLRGSAVALRHEAAIFLGPPGIGKSTLAIGLMQKGYRLVADELCVIRSDSTGNRRVAPGPKLARLWPDALNRLGIESNGLVTIRKGVGKKNVPINERPSGEEPLLRKVYLLHAGLNTSIEVTPLDAQAAYTALQSRIYLDPVMQGAGVQATYLQALVSFAQKVPFVGVTRPRKKSSAQDLIAKIEAEFAA